MITGKPTGIQPIDYELALYTPGSLAPQKLFLQAGCDTEAAYLAQRILKQRQQPFIQRALRTPPRGKRKLTRAQRKEITANISLFHVNVGRITS